MTKKKEFSVGVFQFSISVIDIDSDNILVSGKVNNSETITGFIRNFIVEPNEVLSTVNYVKILIDNYIDNYGYESIDLKFLEHKLSINGFK